MGKENRKYFRFDSLNTVAYFCLGEAETVVSQGMGRTLNLSENGVLLHTYRPIDNCERIQVHIGLREELIELKGRLIHRGEDPVKGFQYGIEFIEIKKEDRATLNKFVKEFKRKGPNHGAGCI